MAREIIIRTTDDLDRMEGISTLADVTREIVIDGVLHVVDLTNGHNAELNMDLARWLKAAHDKIKVTVSVNGKKTEHSSAGRVKLSKEMRERVRQWAADNGRELAKRGYIPTDVIDAFYADNSDIVSVEGGAEVKVNA